MCCWCWNLLINASKLVNFVLIHFKVATIGFDEVYEVYELYWIYGLIYFRLDH